MGDASPPKEEHILVTVPFAVNSVIKELQAKFPHIKITVWPQQWVNKRIIQETIPDGKLPRLL